MNLNSEWCRIYSLNGFKSEPGYENKPVVKVSWFGAKAYAEYCGGRLPTEAEWEFAAKGGNNSKGFIYSGSNNLDEVAWSDFNMSASATIHPVGEKNANELGIHDMTGNVKEWVNDWYSVKYYRESPINNPQGPLTGHMRVTRGGGFDLDNFYVSYRSSRYIEFYPNHIYTFTSVGFRPVFPE